MTDLNSTEPGESNNAFEQYTTVNEINLRTETNATFVPDFNENIKTSLEVGSMRYEENIGQPTIEETKSEANIVPEKESAKKSEDDEDDDDDDDEDDCCDLNKRCVIIMFTSVGVFIVLIVTLFIVLSMTLQKV